MHGHLSTGNLMLRHVRNKTECTIKPHALGVLNYSDFARLFGVWLGFPFRDSPGIRNAPWSLALNNDSCSVPLTNNINDVENPFFYAQGLGYSQVNSSPIDS